MGITVIVHIFGTFERKPSFGPSLVHVLILPSWNLANSSDFNLQAPSTGVMHGGYKNGQEQGSDEGLFSLHQNRSIKKFSTKK